METINQHEFANDAAQTCIHCGTSRGMVASGYGCIHRAMPPASPGPRTISADDFDFINARLKVLAAERAAIEATKSTV